MILIKIFTWTNWRKSAKIRSMLRKYRVEKIEITKDDLTVFFLNPEESFSLNALVDSGLKKAICKYFGLW